MLFTHKATALVVKNNYKKKFGFTLIELLAVISLIAVLAGFLLPIVNKARDTGDRTKAANHLRQIALAYNLALNDTHPSGLSTGLTAHEAALEIAQAGDFRDPSLFLIPGDPELVGRPAVHAIFSDATQKDLDSNFKATPLAYTIAVGVPIGSNGDTPIAWTRGLQTDGTWSKDSPYQGKGGHVAFLDGHVKWYSKTTNAFRNAQNKPTSNFTDALPATAKSVSANVPRVI